MHKVANSYEYTDRKIVVCNTHGFAGFEFCPQCNAAPQASVPILSPGSSMGGPADAAPGSDATGGEGA